MIGIGCDFHPAFQQIAILDMESGECEQRKLGGGTSLDSQAKGLLQTVVSQQAQVLKLLAGLASGGKQVGEQNQNQGLTPAQSSRKDSPGPRAMGGRAFISGNRYLSF